MPSWASEHPLFRGAITRCAGLVGYACDQAKQRRIKKVTATLRTCERGVVRSCEILLQVPDLSDLVHARAQRGLVTARAGGGGNPLTQFLRRNSQEAPPGAYDVPQITVRSGVPAGVSSGYPAGVSTGYPAGVSTGTGPAYSGVPPGVSTGTNGAYAGYPDGVTAGTGGAFSAYPDGISTGHPAGVSTGIPEGVRTGVPDGVSAGIPEGVSAKQGAHAAVPDGVTTGTDGAYSGFGGAHAGIPDGVTTSNDSAYSGTSGARPSKTWTSIPTSQARDSATKQKADEVIAKVGVPRKGIGDDVAARHKKGMEFVKDSPEVQDAIRSLQIKAGAYSAGGRAGYEVADFALTVDGAFDSVKEFKSGEYYDGSLKALNVTSSLIANRTPAGPFGDVLNLAGAATTAYLYGYTKGYDASKPAAK